MAIGMLGAFQEIDAACDAIAALRKQNVGTITVFSPTPRHEFEHALQPPRSPVRMYTLIGALSDVRTQIGALAAQGLTFEEARAKWDFTKLKTTFCGDDPWKRFLLNAFYLGALTQNAWKEAKGIPIVQGKDVVLLESVYDA